MRLLIAARNRTVGLDGGRVVAPEGRFDTTLSFPDAEVRPGLINAHDHLHRNHYGRLGVPPYRSAYAWAHDIQARYAAHIAERRAVPRREALFAGAWKNLFAGVTSVVHHDAWEADFEAGFPLRVVRVQSADSLGMTPAVAPPPRGLPFCLHLAEGIDPAAAAEVGSAAGRGLLGPDLIAVHGVGMDQAGIARFRASGAALVWCPTSNLFLFGRTAPAALLASGLDVLLGSDSRLTGAGDLLDELRHAQALGLIDDQRLEAAVGTVAARRLGFASPSLEPGARADLVVLARPLLVASARDVLLVVAGGIPRVASLDLAPVLNRIAPGGAPMRIGPVTRWTYDMTATEGGS
ncbi:MAG TPA: amidohydrolase family protein [Sphingomonas sp.]|nr:amidohydrolase family protein [Sphingomonas sp.]